MLNVPIVQTFHILNIKGVEIKMSDSQVLLNIIDARVKKIINENKLLKQYCGIISGYILDGNGNIIHNKYQVRLLGDDTIFTFLNKTGEALSVGDYVYVQTVGTDLNTGVIIYNTKESQASVKTAIDCGTTTEGWNYTKWSNGDIDFWGKKHYDETDQSYNYQNYSITSLNLQKVDYVGLYLEQERGITWVPDVILTVRASSKDNLVVTSSRPPNPNSYASPYFGITIVGKGRWK